MTKEEFDAYCTIPSPAHPGDRVFYPYYILSRPEAIKVKWGWTGMDSVAGRMLDTMRRQCNKDAEKAGLGEKDVDATKLLCWRAHKRC